MELIVTFEKPFVTGGEKDKGGGDRMEWIISIIIINSLYFNS